ncbi:MAG: serine/threonine-protein kinase [Pseudoxanthomonas sp.]
MSSERDQQAMRIFEQLADLPATAQTARLDELCAGDAELRALVVAMLAADGRADEPFSGRGSQWHDELVDNDTGDAADAAPGRSIGAWEITGVLGRGGMGAVYAARRNDGAYDQLAALKLIRSAADSPLARERFLRERQTLARLHHPNIATLLDGGFTPDGDPYFVMEYVDGIALDQYCDANQLGLRERVELFAQVLDAVQYAHRNLVVHRDLKPSNLLVDGEGRVKLLDFGIAKQLRPIDLVPGDATITIDRALTFEYASPEQLHDAPITTATDIWQLGIVLHRLLSGSHPFGLSRDTPLPKQLQLLEREPEPLTRAVAQASAEQAAQRGEVDGAALAKALRGGLAAIVETCLRREPAARYPSADALAADLQRWLQHRPVNAAHLGKGARAALWLRRNRLLAASMAAVTFALLAGAGVALWQANEAHEQAEMARTQARIAEQQRNTAQAQTKKASQTLLLMQDALFGAAPQGQLSAQFSLNDLIDNSRKTLDKGRDLDPDVRKSMQRTLANLYGIGQDWANAEAMYRPGLDGVTPYDHDDAAELANHFGNYAQVLGVMGKPKEAIAAATRAADLRRQYLPDDLFEQAVSQRNLADAYLSAGDNANAQQHYEQAIAQFRKIDKPDQDQVATIDALVAFIGLGRCLIAQTRYQPALQIIDEAIALADRHDMPALWDGRAVLLSLKATAQKNLGDAAGALASFQQGTRILGQTLGADNPALANGYIGIGGSLNDLDRPREALEAFAHAERIIAGKQVQAGTDAKIYAGYGMAWGKLGNAAKRADYYRRALAALEKADSAPLLELKRKIAAEAATGS